MPKTTLTEDRMVEILENIAEHGTNQAAQIAAIKELRAINKGQVSVADGFAKLDAVATGHKLKAV
jgi:hypothetical protein